jgi:hypothetical protein
MNFGLLQRARDPHPSRERGYSVRLTHRPIAGIFKGRSPLNPRRDTLRRSDSDRPNPRSVRYGVMPDGVGFCQPSGGRRRSASGGPHVSGSYSYTGVA